MTEYKVEVLRHPEDEDWERCKMLAMNTIGRKWGGAVSDEWKHKIIKAGHSPIRTLMFTIRITLPYWVSVHFCRHKYGVEHYVSSQRNDRQDKYDREAARQDAPVMHVMDVNAQELIQMARMRLCGQSAPETRRAMQLICRAVIAVNPEFKPFLVPKCRAIDKVFYCNEFRPCGESTRFLP